MVTFLASDHHRAIHPLIQLSMVERQSVNSKTLGNKALDIVLLAGDAARAGR
jgi:hypothetical protein